MDATGSSKGTTGFGRMLVVLDGSADAEAASVFVEGATGRFGAVRVVRRGGRADGAAPRRAAGPQHPQRPPRHHLPGERAHPGRTQPAAGRPHRRGGPPIGRRPDCARPRPPAAGPAPAGGQPAQPPGGDRPAGAHGPARRERADGCARCRSDGAPRRAGGGSRRGAVGPCLRPSWWGRTTPRVRPKPSGAPWTWCGPRAGRSTWSPPCAPKEETAPELPEGIPLHLCRRRGDRLAARPGSRHRRAGAPQCRDAPDAGRPGRRHHPGGGRAGGRPDHRRVGDDHGTRRLTGVPKGVMDRASCAVLVV